MAKLSLTQFLTLDGVYQAPGGPEEDPSGGFDLGGWSVPYGDDDFGAFMNEVFRTPTAFLLGRRTYEIFANYWPRQTDPADPVAAKLNGLPKYVASTTLEAADWAGTTVIGREDVAEEVAELKRGTEGEIQMHGSGALAQSLMAHDLVDVLHLLVFPVVLGKGMRLFARGTTASAFRHTAARTTGSGVAIHTYEFAGRPAYGSYA
ncbi:dihydrofolate reductase family protein [Streptomyces zhihengii]